MHHKYKMFQEYKSSFAFDGFTKRHCHIKILCVETGLSAFDAFKRLKELLGSVEIKTLHFYAGVSKSKNCSRNKFFL